MSNPRPDPPRLAAIRYHGDGATCQIGSLCSAIHFVDARALDDLLSDLRTLEAQYRERSKDRRALFQLVACVNVADDLAALLARLEGT